MVLFGAKAPQVHVLFVSFQGHFYGYGKDLESTLDF